MNYSDLLDRADQVKIDILKYLIFYPKEAKKKTIYRKLELSPQVFNIYLDELNYEIVQKMGIEAEIVEHKSKLALKKAKNVYLFDFVDYYLKKSYKYKILLYLLENGGFTYSALENYLIASRSTVYRKLMELNVSLQEFNIEVSNGEMKGSETQIRYFFYLFIDTFKVNYLKKESEKKKFSNIINRFEDSFGYPLADTTKNKMEIWMYVVYRRYSIHNEFNFNEKLNLVELMQYSKFYKKVRTILIESGQKDKFISSESDRVYAYAMSFYFDFFSERFQEYLQWDVQIKKEYHELEQTSDLIRDFIMDKFSIDDLSKRKYDKIQFLLMQEILLLMSFSGYIFSYDEDNFTYSINSHPKTLFVKHADEFIEKVCTIWNIKELDFKKSSHRNFRYKIIGIFRYIELLTESPLQIAIRIQGNLLTQSLIQKVWERYLKGTISIAIQPYAEENKKNYDLIISNHRSMEDTEEDNIYVLSDLNAEFDIEQVKNMLKRIRVKDI